MVKLSIFISVLSCFPRLRAHHPLLGDNDGHPVGLSLFENDIAVIKLEDETEFQCKKKTIWPACLPTQARQRTGKTMLATNNNDNVQNETYEYWFKAGLAGWGQTVNNGNVSTSLMKAR